MKDLEKKWEELIKRLEKQFDDEISLKGILYLIGVQELNFWHQLYIIKKKNRTRNLNTRRN